MEIGFFAAGNFLAAAFLATALTTFLAGLLGAAPTFLGEAFGLGAAFALGAGTAFAAGDFLAGATAFFVAAAVSCVARKGSF